MTYVILPQALYNGFIGAALRPGADLGRACGAHARRTSALSSARPVACRAGADRGRRRVMVIAAIGVRRLLLIVGQLWYLQVLEGGRFQEAVRQEPHPRPARSRRRAASCSIATACRWSTTARPSRSR